MQTPTLTHTPLTRTLLIYTIASSVLLSILDSKHLASIHISPHFWPYGQFWRALIWQVAGFANSTEALFAALLVYNLRVVERGWGGRKVATFILSTLPYTTLLPPLLLTVVLRPLTLHKLNYLPSGPTATLFALLVQYYVEVPHTVSYRVSTSSSSPSSTSPSTSSSTNPATNPTEDQNQHQQETDNKGMGILLTDKSPVYLVAAQLALSQFPAMFLPALIGWGVGLAWRAEVLPFLGSSGRRGGGVGGWRVPAWVVGERDSGSRSGFASSRSGGEGGRYEGLRRRLEGEASAVASASSAASAASGSGEGRRRRD
ncbi:protein dscB [Aspergillus candidus]|uniref:UBA domain-containing protein Ucp14 n=1 Tax=Aspergillus candidus TaxID=41067 RepID=A0A2I2EY62_ASPCN|nr:hypothetical protein BDW47DRAFT_135248 [Aspergillus candidus]PLB33312.1 hypothetical protein BDW47DRAFT_135248 [Aspergillus candidus]